MGTLLARPSEIKIPPRPRCGLIIVAVYLILTLLLTLPLTFHLTTHLPFGGDAFQTVWDFWWLEKCYSEKINPLYTTYMFAPEGTSLALHDMTWSNSLLSVPLQWVLGNRILIFNLFWLASIVFSGYFMYLYSRRHLGDGIPAFAAGCLFAFSTYHLHHGPQLGSMWIGWLPLFQLYLEEALSSGGRWKSAAKASIILAVAAYTHWYLAAFCIFQLLQTFIWNGFTFRPFPAASIVRSIFILAAAAILTLPILLPAAIESGKVENVELKIEQRERYGVDAASLIIPSPRHPVWKNYIKPLYTRISGNITESPVYPGWVLWLLVIAALIGRAAGRWRFVFFSFCFLILALGTKPHFLGHEAAVPLPYKLFQYIPGLDFIRVPSRFMAPAMLFLSLLAAQGLAYIIGKIRGVKAPIYIGVVIILLALFDTTILPLPTRDTTKYSDFYSTLAKEEGDFLIFDYPAYTYQEYLYYQTIHEKPIISGYGIYLSPERTEWLISLNDEPWNIEGLNVRYVILHKGYKNPSRKGTISYEDYEFPPMVYFWEATRYIIIHDDRYIRVFKVP